MTEESSSHAGVEESGATTADAALARYYQRRDAGEEINPEEFIAQYPEFADELRATIETAVIVDQIFELNSGVGGGSSIDSWTGETDDEESSVSLTAEVPLQWYIEQLLGLELIEPVTLAKSLEEYQRGLSTPGQAADFGLRLVEQGVLTRWQHERLLHGQADHLTLHHYRLQDHLGSGGMGAVYLAEHKLMRRQVAIKVLPPKRLKKQSSLDRFVREAQAVAALDHPNIVKAYSIDNWGDLHYLVMEYVQGEDLWHIVRRTGPLEPRDAAEYIRQAALGLDHAHEQGIIHRDIKPSNLLLDDQGTIKILDMGLALCLGGDEPSTTLEHRERTIGTADYMAPEQARDSHGVDLRADIYSLGCTLYFLLVGHVPFPDGTLAERLLDHQEREPEPLQNLRPEIPAVLAKICARMLAKKPTDRFQTAGEVAEALEHFLHPEAAFTAATPDFDGQKLERVRRQPAHRLWPYAAAGVLGVIGLVIWMTAPRDAEHPPELPAAKHRFVDKSVKWRPDVPLIPPAAAVHPGVYVTAKVDNPKASSSLTQDTPVVAGHVYRAEVTLSTQKLSKPANVILKFYDDSGQGLVQTELQNSYRPVGTTAWMRYVVAARAPAGAVKARLYVHFGTYSSGTVQLGEASLQEGNGPNLLTNGDFIQGLQSWRVSGDANVTVSAGP